VDGDGGGGGGCSEKRSGPTYLLAIRNTVLKRQE
jgi:hypothetical protein